MSKIWKGYTKPKCFKCNRLADYFKHGILWVCCKCYPFDK